MLGRVPAPPSRTFKDAPDPSSQGGVGNCNQHETVVEGNNTMVLVDYDEHGGRADLDEQAARCLNNRPLEGKVPARKRRRLDEHSIGQKDGCKAILGSSNRGGQIRGDEVGDRIG